MRLFAIPLPSILRPLAVALVIIMLLTSASPVALAEDQTDVYNSGILDFDISPGANCTTSSDGVSSSALPPDIVQAINKLKPVYIQAAQATGVPWQLLAAVHYREANNDPNHDLQAGNPIGGPWGQDAGYPYGHPTSLEQSAEFAAKQLIDLSKEGVVQKPINVPSPDPDAIKDTLFSYNGRAAAYAQQAASLGFDPVKQPYEGSPYVMNNFDAKHHDMKIITQDHGGLDGIDTRFGAFTVYSLLGGGTGSSSDGCSGPGAVAGSIVQTAINYAWPDYHAAPYIEVKPAYAAAIAKAQANGEYVGGLDGEPGIDCGGFVTRVMRDSGADPNYNWGPSDSRQGPTTSQQAYMDAHPEKYQKLGQMTSTATLQAGDIAINSSHTFIYVGSQPGFNGNTASASVAPAARAPMAGNVYFSNDSGPFTWYRLIK